MQNTTSKAAIRPLTIGRAARTAASRARVEAAMNLKPSARDMFAFLRPLLLDSRPLLKPAEFVKRDILIGGKYRTRSVQVKPPVYGRPTFRNRIENGKHV